MQSVTTYIKCVPIKNLSQASASTQPEDNYRICDQQNLSQAPAPTHLVGPRPYLTFLKSYFF